MNSTLRSPRFRRALRRAAVVALFGSLVAVPIVQGQQRPRFGTRVDVVQFQVRVTDGSGNFVPGLKASDFQLEVDGSARDITTVYQVDVTGDGSGVVPAEMPAAAWRQWVLFFDAAFNSPRGVIAAQEAARNFVETQARPQDLIGVATFSTVRGAELVVPPTRDREQVLLAIDGLGLNTATRAVDRAGFLAQTMNEGGITGAPSGGGQGTAAVAGAVEEAIQQVNSLEFQQYAAVVEQYATQLGTIGGMLRSIRGRKHVVYFSKGFADAVLSGESLDALASTNEQMQQNAGLAIAQSSAEQRFGSTQLRSELDSALAVFRSADAVIHVIDPSGLGGDRDTSSLGTVEVGRSEFSARGGSRSALTSLAEATGGELYWNSNDIDAAIGEIEEQNRDYYVLAFPRQGGDKDVLKLKVSVSAPGATVDAPKELAAPIDFADMSDVEKQIQLAEFVSKGIVANDMEFEVRTAAFYGDGETSRLPVVIEVPWEQLETLANDGKDDKVELEIYSYAIDDNDSMVDLSNQEISLDIGRMSKSRAAGLPFRYYDLLWARPGQRRVRVILRDKELGRISAVTTEPTTVPEHASGEVAIGGPVPVDWDHPGLIVRGFDASKPPPPKKDGPVDYPFTVGKDDVTPEAADSGAPGTDHYAYFVAYNLGSDANGQAHTSVAMALQSPMGQFLQPPQAMVASYYDGDTDATHMIAKATIPEGTPSGFYRLVVMLNDQLKGQRVQGSYQIWVEGQ